MFKELILAVILGALLGFGLTGGYFALNNNRKNNNSPDITPTPIPVISSAANPKITPEPSEIPDVQNTNNLVIESPENESIVSNSKTTISGKSLPQSTILITTSQNTYHQNTKENGSFSIDIELESGANIINVFSIDNQDNQISTQMIITYSTAKI